VDESVPDDFDTSKYAYCSSAGKIVVDKNIKDGALMVDVANGGSETVTVGIAQVPSGTLTIQSKKVTDLGDVADCNVLQNSPSLGIVDWDRADITKGGVAVQSDVNMSISIPSLDLDLDYGVEVANKGNIPVDPAGMLVVGDSFANDKFLYCVKEGGTWKSTVPSNTFYSNIGIFDGLVTNVYIGYIQNKNAIDGKNQN